MNTSDSELVPQAEEDIEKAEWVSPDGLPEIKAEMYPSLHQVVDAALLTM